jgi:O-antigen/teichoic acid export membrane protein
VNREGRPQLPRESAEAAPTQPPDVSATQGGSAPVVRSMIRHSAVYMLPTILTKGLGFLLLPIYTHAFAPSDYGALDLITSLGPMVQVVICLEVVQGMVRLRVDVPPDERARLTGTTWLFSLLMYALFVAVALPAAPWLATHVLGGSNFTDIARAGIVAMSTAALATMFLSQFRWELRSTAYTILTTLYAVTTMAVAATMALVLEFGVLGVLVGQAVSATIFCLVAIVLARTSVRWVLSGPLLRRMLAYSWPLVPASLSVTLTLYFDRIALTVLTTLDEVGVFGVAARLASVIIILVAALQTAVMPLILAHHTEPRTPASLAKIFRWALAILLGICLVLHLAATRLVELLAPPSYAEAADLVPVLALAMMLNQLYVFFPGMALAMKTRQQLAVTVAGAVVSLVANFALIPVLGALGAAVASLAAALAFLMLWTAASQRHYPIPLEGPVLLRGLLLFVAVSAAAYALDDSGLSEPAADLVKLGLLVVFGVGLLASGMTPPRELRTGLRSALGREPTEEAPPTGGA